MSLVEPEVAVLPGAQDVARRGAEELVRAARESIESRGLFTVALSGGSTPVGMFRLLASEDYRQQVEWPRVLFFWSDERCVPPDHPDSNFGAANEALLRPLAIPEQNIHRMRGELDPAQAAQEYTDVIRQWLPGSPPRFDLILLGMGDDGHTASLFPHTAALQSTDLLVAPNYVPKLDVHRITFTPRLINAARRVVFLVAGGGKAEALRAVLEGEHNPDTYPAQLVAPVDGSLLWAVDEAAAAQLSTVQAGTETARLATSLPLGGVIALGALLLPFALRRLSRRLRRSRR